jgi:putative protease
MVKIMKNKITPQPPLSGGRLNPPTPFTKGGIPELIAPAGNLEKMKTAFAFGADAVYLGIPDFSLRVRINDFTLKSLKEAVLYAHGLKKKVYVTINIFAHNRHIDKLPKYVLELKKIKPDGLIISDPGVAAQVKEIWPDAKLHLSTQANCTNWQAAKFWFEQGFKRIVLGRETTIDEIKKIKEKNPKLEIESFIHGAMCMAYSGRCFLSKYFTGRSANQGDCIQPCRWKYNTTINNSQSRALGINNFKEALIQPENRGEVLELVEEEHGSYILNSKDLCLIKRIPEMMAAGISSFKIEGRAKSVYYLACVVGAYRKAIDAVAPTATPSPSPTPAAGRERGVEKKLDFLYKELSDKLFNRGFTEGFMFGDGKMAQNLENSHKVPKWEFCGIVETRRGASGRSEKFDVYIKIHNTMKVGDSIEIIMPGYDIIKMKLKKMFNAETGEEIIEAHGGQGLGVFIESDVLVPEYSVVRRKIG